MAEPDNGVSRPSILDLSFAEIGQVVADWDLPAYRARQIWHALYQRRSVEPSSLTELPVDLRHRLGEAFAFRSLHVRDRQVSEDGRATKFLLTTQTGHPVEAVQMRYDRRHTACISTQSGCGMGCTFCATGQLGFLRNLTPGEIVEQVLWLMDDRPLTNIVFMGMGEPFHNYEASLDAVNRLTDPEGLRFGARRITLSTVGIVPMIRRFTEERRQVNLAVSLHAATDALRDDLVPINRRYPLAELFEACRDYVRVTRRRLTFEWALIQNLNDGQDQARALVERIQGMLCHVNLIPLNPTQGFAGGAPDPARAEAFRAALAAAGLSVTLRVRRGIDIQAGCGQLAGRMAADAPSPGTDSVLG